MDHSTLIQRCIVFFAVIGIVCSIAMVYSAIKSVRLAKIETGLKERILSIINDHPNQTYTLDDLYFELNDHRIPIMSISNMTSELICENAIDATIIIDGIPAGQTHSRMRVMSRRHNDS